MGWGCVGGVHATFVVIAEYWNDAPASAPPVTAWQAPSAGSVAMGFVHCELANTVKVAPLHVAVGAEQLHEPQPPPVIPVPTVCFCVYPLGQATLPACATHTVKSELPSGAQTCPALHPPAVPEAVHIFPSPPPGEGGVSVTIGVQLPPVGGSREAEWSAAANGKLIATQPPSATS